FLGRRFDHLHDVAAGGKGARPRAREDHDASVVVAFDFRQLLVQLAGKLVAQGIELFRTIQSNNRDLVDALGENILVTHDFSPYFLDALQQKGRKGATKERKADYEGYEGLERAQHAAPLQLVPRDGIGSCYPARLENAGCPANLKPETRDPKHCS